MAQYEVIDPAARRRRSARLARQEHRLEAGRPAVSSMPADGMTTTATPAVIPATRLAAITLASVAAGVHAVLIAQQGQIWWGYGALIAAIAIAGAAIAIASRGAPDHGRPLRGDRRHGDEHAALRHQPHRSASRSGPAPLRRCASPIRCTARAIRSTPSLTGPRRAGRAARPRLPRGRDRARRAARVSMLPRRPAPVRRRTSSAPWVRHSGCSDGPESSPDPTHPAAGRARRAGGRRAVRAPADPRPRGQHAADPALRRRDRHRPAVARAARAAPRRDGGREQPERRPRRQARRRRRRRLGRHRGRRAGRERQAEARALRRLREHRRRLLRPRRRPKGDVFLLGDNRGNSEDSRDFGPCRRTRSWVACWCGSGR